jgi:hypothetical protein
MTTNESSNGSVDKLVHQTSNLVVSRPGKGFLDLPGELRNQVYEYVFLSCSTLDRALAVCSSSRQVRSEYLPLFFERGKVYLHFYLIQRFLEVFFPSDATEDNKKKAVCTICINIAESNPRGSTRIDMQWLIRFLLEHPGVNISFFGNTVLDRVARDLKKLVAIARLNPIWHNYLVGFSSIYMIFAENRGRSLNHAGILQFYQKPGDEMYYSNDAKKCRRQIRELLFDLGLVLPNGSESGRKIFSEMKIAVYTQNRNSRIPGSYKIQLW